jgi:hypothetical protein
MFARSSGMSYETQLPYLGETGHGFRWEGDPLRVYTAFFYHLSYVIGKFCGAAGSFVPYQSVYAGLWFARGFLVFLILRRVMPDAAVLPFTAGALTIVHASDATLQWVGQMNQAGFIFWGLAAIYLFIVAVQQASAIVVIACICECLCLWSYESPLFIICATPFVVALLIRPKSLKRYLVLCAAWFLFPAWYVHMAYWRYTHAGLGYQTSVMRKTWSVSASLSDLVFKQRSAAGSGHDAHGCDADCFCDRRMDELAHSSRNRVARLAYPGCRFCFPDPQFPGVLVARNGPEYLEDGAPLGFRRGDFHQCRDRHHRRTAELADPRHRGANDLVGRARGDRARGVASIRLVDAPARHAGNAARGAAC